MTNVAADPYPLYHELRERGDGVHYLDPVNAYFAFRYDDVLRISKDSATFSSDMFWQSPSSHHDRANPEHQRFVEFNRRLMVFRDPPVHTQIRNVVKAAFTPRAVEHFRRGVEQSTDELLDRISPGDEIDLVRDFAFHVPVAIITEVLGVPGADRAKFHQWSFSFASTFDFSVQGEARDNAIRDTLLLIDYLSDFAEDRRRSPRDDLTSMIVNGRPGDAIELQDLEAQVFFLLSAGNETTANMVTNGVTRLLEHPDAHQRLSENPDLIPVAVEEMLRYDPPLHLITRRTVRETRLGETNIPVDTMVFEVIPAANRDPRRFDNPGAFDITRTNNKHLSFNQGIHFCVGAPLARLEGDVIFRKLLGRFPKISAGSHDRVRRPTVALRGWQSCPVIFDV